jgi:hypothetical protein
VTEQDTFNADLLAFIKGVETANRQPPVGAVG